MTLTTLFKKTKHLAMVFAAGLMLVACGGGGSSNNTGGGTTYDLDTLGVPKFIATNYLDVSAQVGGIQSISKISKFRSSVGHDYSDSKESCRSMKHYFMTPATTTDIVSPVAGKIRTIYEESQGTQIGITPDAQPAFEIRIFHINKVKTFTVGESVSAGQKLGTHYTAGTYSDVAVFVSTPSGNRAVSYFEALTDAAFQPYKDMGINAPSDLIITKAQRDAAPLTCSGETFTNAGSDTLPQWQTLISPIVATISTAGQIGPNTGATGSTEYTGVFTGPVVSLGSGETMAWSMVQSVVDSTNVSNQVFTGSGQVGNQNINFTFLGFGNLGRNIRIVTTITVKKNGVADKVLTDSAISTDTVF